MEKGLSYKIFGHRRLIPLTSEIIKAMMDFNGSNAIDISNSLSELVKKEIENCLEELDSSICKCVKREEISEIVNQCIEEKLPTCSTVSTRAASPPKAVEPSDRDMEVTIQFVDNKSSNEQLALKENFAILEHRICTLESRISSIFQVIPRLKKISGNFKIDRKTLQQSIEKCINEVKKDKASIGDTLKSAEIKPDIKGNAYDEMFYEWRQNNMNEKCYKRSGCSLTLNKNIEMEQFHGPPIKNTLPNGMTKRNNVLKPKFVKSQDLVGKH